MLSHLFTARSAIMHYDAVKADRAPSAIQAPGGFEKQQILLHSLQDSMYSKIPLKSTSPFLSSSNISITRCTSGFCCSSGSIINSSVLIEPELSKSNFLNRLPNLLISSASTEKR